MSGATKKKTTRFIDSRNGLEREKKVIEGRPQRLEKREIRSSYENDQGRKKR